MDKSDTLNPDSEKKGPGPLGRLDRHIQSRTLAGLIGLVPLLATVIVIFFFVGHADSLIRPLFFVSGHPWDFTGIGIIVFFIIFYLMGVLVAIPGGRRVMDVINTVLGHTPVVKTIFGVTQQATSAITSQYNFSRVVFIEWPREGMIAMGFVTGRVYSQSREWTMVAVYVPTVPNPTSGNMAFVPEDDVIETDLSVEAAMKLVFSGGIVLPSSFSLARMPRELSEEPRGMVGRFETEY